jgi:hypothetical protein
LRWYAFSPVITALEIGFMLANEAESLCAMVTQDIPCLFWNTKVYYHVHKMEVHFYIF